MEQYRLSALPRTAYYIPNFISADEERRILSEIERLPQAKWTVLSHRRLLSLPSALTGPAKDKLIAAPLPKFLEDPILPRFDDLNVFTASPHGDPNHCLVNEYQPGEGIMPHTDGPAYHPTTATVSLGGHTVLEIYKRDENGERESRATWRILQEPRSLLVTTDDMYKDTLHGIADVEEDSRLDSTTIVNWNLLGDSHAFSRGSSSRTTRVSLTYRDVPKVAKIGGALKFINKR